MTISPAVADAIAASILAFSAALSSGVVEKSNTGSDVVIVNKVVILQLYQQDDLADNDSTGSRTPTMSVTGTRSNH